MPKSPSELKEKTAKPAKTTAKKEKFAQVFQFRITLREIEPPIWRQIQVPESYTFYDLHVAIQNAMGWTDSHMHQFEIVNPLTEKDEILGYPFEDFDDIETIPVWERQIQDYLSGKNLGFTYIYDLGDSWVHFVVLEDILPRKVGVKYPVCLDGRRACPPEDCGGVSGYEDLVKALTSEDPEERAEYLEWVGPDYQIEYFDPKKVRFENPKKRLKEVLEHV